MVENNANQNNVQGTQNILREEEQSKVILENFENMRKMFEEKRNASVQTVQTGGNEPSFDISKEISKEEIDNQAKQLSGFSFEGTSVKYSENSKK